MKEPSPLCSACGARLSQYNRGPRCYPCQDRHADGSDGDPDALPAPHASFGEKADEVLSVAQDLLEVQTNPSLPGRAANHAAIAGAFLIRFIIHGWSEDFERAVEAAYAHLGRVQGRAQVWEMGGVQLSLWLAERGLNLDLNLMTPEMGPAQGGAGIHPTALSLSDVLVIPGLSETKVHLWSALVPDEELHQQLAEAFAVRLGETGVEQVLETGLKAEFREPQGGSGLPRIVLTLRGTAIPSPRWIVEWYRQGAWQRWQHRLWDGRAGLERKRLPSNQALVRGWTIYALQVYAGLGLRDALRAWNARAPDPLQLPVGKGARMARENQAVQERDRARAAADTLHALISGPTRLQS